MTSNGFSGVARASWQVSPPSPICLPGPLPPDPAQPRGIESSSMGRPETWVPLVGWSQGAWLVGLEGPRAQIPQLAKQLPSPERVRDSWKEDALFGYQFLNGANPMVLRLSAHLPARLVFPPGMEELQAQLEKELEVRTSEPRGGSTVQWGGLASMMLLRDHSGPGLLPASKAGFCRRGPEGSWRSSAARPPSHMRLAAEGGRARWNG